MSADAPQPTGPDGALRAAAILPARLGSTRLARKMLLRESGRYLFEHSARNVLASGAVRRVVIATDSEEIVAAALEVGLEALLTSAAHPSGTDRVHEAWQQLEARGEGPWDVVLNVQADEPDVAGADLARLVAAFADPEVQLASLCVPLAADQAATPSAVKVVRDARGDALYFSRAAIPDGGHARAGAAPAHLRHVGVYAFRPSALARFVTLPPGRLEALENLEQLRWLEAGLPLRVLDAEHAPNGIDTPADYAAFVARVRRAHPTSRPSANT